jgi:hypothetical protein
MNELDLWPRVSHMLGNRGTGDRGQGVGWEEGEDEDRKNEMTGGNKARRMTSVRGAEG